MPCKKIEVFQNFIQHIPTKFYQFLMNGILDGLKFPGTGVSDDMSCAFINLVRFLNCSVDNHGWKGITAQFHDSNFSNQITSFDGLSDYLNLPGAWRYSGHIGASSCKLPVGEISQEDFNSILIKNLAQTRKTIYHYSKHEAEIYGEGVYPYYHDPRTITPDFLNATLKSHGLENGLDGLVLDICHASICCDYLSIVYNKQYTIKDYLSDLDCSAVKIIHCSGGNMKLTSDTDYNFLNDNNMDPHLCSETSDWYNLLFVLDSCPNVIRVSNEIAYTGCQGNPVTVRDYCKEAILTKVAVDTRSMKAIDKAINLLNSLQEDCDNLDKVISDCKKILV